MEKNEVVVRFDKVSFQYNDKKIVLDNADFSVRKNSKITIMGQNGAGKSTIFKLLTDEIKPRSGKINIALGVKIAIALQMMPAEYMNLNIVEYFEKAFSEKVYGIEKNIKNVLEVVNLSIDLQKKVSDLSGGQKARLLLAFALIQEPDILLLDEPTNNLDSAGIEHLTDFLVAYKKTCIVISHDADFLNAFTDGVLNLDVHTKKVEQFVGNYYDVVEQISAQIERERMANVRITRSIADRFEKVNKLGGKSVAMRRLANKVRADIEEDREKIVDIRQEDKTLPKFTIPAQNCSNPVVTFNSIDLLINHKVETKKVDIELNRGNRLLISGPNGIGKSTLLGSILRKHGVTIKPEVRIGYYSQDFSELNFDDKVIDSLSSVAQDIKVQEIYATAGKFMLPGEILQHTVGSLSEGQKGLLCYARFVLQKPGLLIMDEPTNHINFRHIPVIAEAIDKFEGVLILVSHVYSFISQIRIDDELDLQKFIK